jgi:hypothetical protein
MTYERRLEWRKLPTEVFVCAKKSLKRGGNHPSPSAPNLCNTLKIHLSAPSRCGAARGLTDTTVGHVSLESKKKTLVISPPVVRHARPWCPPEGSRAVVVDVTDPRRNSAQWQWSDSSIRDPSSSVGSSGVMSLCLIRQGIFV